MSSLNPASEIDYDTFQNNSINTNNSFKALHLKETQPSNWNIVRQRLQSIALLSLEEKTNKDSTSWIKRENSDCGFTIRECVIVIVAHLFIGSIAFSFIFEKWPLSTSLYFTVVTLSTVGYGDIVPSTDMGKIFLCLFAVTGVAFLSVALGEVVAFVISVEEKAFKKLKSFSVTRLVRESSVSKGSQTQEMDYTVALEKLAESLNYQNLRNNPYNDNALEEELNNFWYDMMRIIIIRYIPIQVIICVLIASVEPRESSEHRINIVEHFYFWIVTSLSIGYGDITPYGENNRVLATILIFISVGATGDLIGNVIDLVIRHRRLEKLHKLEDINVLMRSMDKLDATNCGKVYLSDYMEFMLEGTGMVDRRLFDELRNEFSKLDGESKGYITKNDLRGFYRNVMFSAKNKLELARYKKQLFEVCQGPYHTSCLEPNHDP